LLTISNKENEISVKRLNMNNKIDNKIAFKVFAWINLIVNLLVLVFIIFYIYVINQSGRHAYQQYHSGLYLTGIIWYFVIRYRFAPSYFGAEIFNNQIRIKTFNPNKYNGFRFLLMAFSQKYVTEYMVDRSSFTNYRINITHCGIKKKLILQKSQKGGIYESRPINLNLLGYKKYTDLILSLERLSQKISLN
jgi:hypothetical protein